MGTVKKCKCGEFKNRPVAVDGVIVKGDQVLLIKRGIEPEKGKWALPGGHVDWDESAEEALRREIVEETGLQVKKISPGVIHSSAKRGGQIISLSYLVQAEGEIETSLESDEVKWFPLNDLPGEIAFDHREIITEVLQDK